MAIEPNLDEIKEISILIDKIDRYKVLVDNTRLQASNLKTNYAHQEILSKKKIEEEIRQQHILETLQTDLDIFRKDELSQKIVYFGNFKKVFDKYFGSSLFQDLVERVSAKLGENDINITGDKVFKVLFKNSKNFIVGADKTLRISNDKVEYILDSEHLEKIVFESFLVGEYTKKI